MDTTTLFDLPLELYPLILNHLAPKDQNILFTCSKATAKFFMQLENDLLNDVDKKQFNDYFKTLLKYFKKSTITSQLLLKASLAKAMKSKNTSQNVNDWFTAFIIMEAARIKGKPIFESVKINSMPALAYALSHDIQPFYSYLLANGVSITKIFYQAIRSNDLISVTKILEADKKLKALSVSQKTNGIFHFIESSASITQILSELIAAGANINSRGYYESNDRSSRNYACWGTPLMYAVDNQRSDVVDLLIQEGADIDIKRSFMNHYTYKNKFQRFFKLYNHCSPITQAAYYANLLASSPQSLQILLSLYKAGAKKGEKAKERYAEAATFPESRTRRESFYALGDERKMNMKRL